MKVMVCASLLLAAQPVWADQKPTGIVWLRDSDGIVISVLHPLDYGPLVPGVSFGGGVVYMMDGNELDFAGGLDMTMAEPGVATPTAVVAGTTYQVEVKGQDVWLRDPVTGVLHPTQRVSSVAGAAEGQINPNGFALD